MISAGLPRRSFIESLLAVPIGRLAPPPQTANPAIMKVAAGKGRADDVIKLPGGDLVYVKVATADTGGALFMTEQPIERRGSGPPKHYHEDQDEWFYCLAGEYVVEIGQQRFRLARLLGSSVRNIKADSQRTCCANGSTGSLVTFAPSVNLVWMACRSAACP